MNYNTDIALLANYRDSLKTDAPASLMIYPCGTVYNGGEAVSRFTNQKDAIQALQGAGFTIRREGDRFRARA